MVNIPFPPPFNLSQCKDKVDDTTFEEKNFLSNF